MNKIDARSKAQLDDKFAFRDGYSVELKKKFPLLFLLKRIINPIVLLCVSYVIYNVTNVLDLHKYILTTSILVLLNQVLLDTKELFIPMVNNANKKQFSFIFSVGVVICVYLFILNLSGYESSFYTTESLLQILSIIVLIPISHFLVMSSLYKNEFNKEKNILVVGANASGLNFRNAILRKKFLKYNFIGFFDDREQERLPGLKRNELIGKLEDIHDFIKNNEVHEIYISLPMSSQPRVQTLVEGLKDTTVSIYFLPDLFTFDLIQAKFDSVAGVPVVCILETPFNGYSGVIKRISDIILSLIILSMIWPVMLAVAIAVKLTSKGPILFKQKRYGLDGQSINVYKFRSMNVMDNGDKIVQATKNDSRLTPIGGFLRSSSLDELPQFLNVLEGTMSIVGPRPHANAHNEHYRKIITGYMLRHKVKPGITGWAQVNGCRGETDTIDKMEARISYDLDYLRNWTLALDIKIVFMTVFKVLRKEGNAY